MSANSSAVETATPPEESPGLSRVRIGGLFAGPGAALLMLWVLPGGPETQAAARVGAVAVWMAIWWITEAIPLGATALLPMVMFPALGVMAPGAVASEYFNDTIFLFIGGFLVALAMERWGLHRRIALAILSWVGARPSALLFGFLIATAFLSMWISNTATAMMMVPIALALIARIEETGAPGARRFAVGVLLAIAYGASIGGVATLVGTPPNLALRSIYESLYPGDNPLTFGRWMLLGVPLAVGMVGSCWGVLTFGFTRGLALTNERDAIAEQRAALGPMTFAQAAVGVLFATLAVLWITRARLDIGVLSIPGWQELFPEPRFITDGVVAVAIGLLLFILPSEKRWGAERLLTASVFRRIPWGIVLLFGGGFALAGAFRESGLSEWIATRSEGLEGNHPVVIIGALCFVTTFLTEVTSNTATANILLPVLGANAEALGLHPLMLMIPGALSCSMAFMLPVATPPNAIVFASDKLSIAQMACVGVILNLIGVVMITLFVWLLAGPVFGI